MKRSKTEEPATVLRFCNACKHETEQEVHAGDGCTAYICVPCRRKSESRELISE